MVMEMDEAIRVLDAWLDAEYEHTRAVFTDPSDDAVSERRSAAAAFLVGGPAAPAGITVGRRPGMAAEEVTAGAARLEEYTRRSLFKVTEHANPLWGRLFAGIVGSPQVVTAGMYMLLYYVADTEEGPRIVSVYDTSPLSPTVEWEHRGGVVVDEPGPVVDVRRLAEPSRERDRTAWAS